LRTETNWQGGGLYGSLRGMAIKQIAFIGTGVMGRSMAGHLIDAGHSLAVYNRTKSKAEDLLAKGAVWKDSPAAAA